VEDSEALHIAQGGTETIARRDVSYPRRRTSGGIAQRAILQNIMISYDLAKKLNDAGFPFKGCNHHAAENCSCQNSPSLSELIEACGPGFGHLYRYEDGVFAAYPAPELLRYRKEWFLCRGNPEEAVANLWLVLNKKTS